jgi:hypothetical protein
MRGKMSRRGTGRGGRQVGSGRIANVANEETYAFVTSVNAGILMDKEVSDFDNNIVEVWDSGTNTHMSPYRDQFLTFETIDPPRKVRAADRTQFVATGIGSMRIYIPNGDKTTAIILQDVLYSPALAFTLVSIICCDKKGFTCTFGDGKCILRNPKGGICGQINQVNGLYQTGGSKMQNNHSQSIAQTVMTVNQLHTRMGHIAPIAAKNMIQSGAVEGIELDYASPIEFCEACVKGKISQNPVPKECQSE